MTKLRYVAIGVILVAFIAELSLFGYWMYQASKAKPAETFELPCNKECEDAKTKAIQQSATMWYWM